VTSRVADRLIVIDPADVEFPASLNLFDAHLERLVDHRVSPALVFVVGFGSVLVALAMAVILGRAI